LYTVPEDGFTCWSTRSIAARYGIGRDTVARIWQARRIRPWKVETFKPSTDPGFESKLRDVVGPYVNPPAAAAVFRFDEKTQVQALDAPSRPCGAGRDAIRVGWSPGTLVPFGDRNSSLMWVIGTSTPEVEPGHQFSLFLRTRLSLTPAGSVGRFGDCCSSQRYRAPMGHADRTENTKAPPTLFVMVGLPASGKTVRAKEIEEAWQALRLTPDEWMIPLFGEPEGGKREILEGRFIWLAIRALRRGINVVLDFGVWTKEERSALRFLANSVGASCELVYLEIDEQEQQRRHYKRFLAEPETTFPMSDDDLRSYREQFEAPDEAELLSFVGPRRFHEARAPKDH
jgi:predicted kinase